MSLPLLFVPGGGEILVLLIMFLPFLFTLWALIDAAKSEFRSSNTKAFWIIGIFVFPFIGAFLYLILGRSQRIKY